MTKDLEEIGEVAHHGPEDLFIAVMTFLGAFVLMFLVNPELALITALIVPVIAWISTRYGAADDAHLAGALRRVGEFNARIEENVGGIRVVQAFANEDHERRALRPGQRTLPRHQAGSLPADGREHVAQLPQHAADAARRDDRREPTSCCTGS